MKQQGGRRNSPIGSPDNRQLYRCPQCHYSSQNKSALVQHVSATHSKEQPSCPFCWIGFKNHLFLRKHINEMHAEITLQTVNSAVQSDNIRVQSTSITVQSTSSAVQCSQCNYSSQNRSAFEQHVKKTHSKEQPSRL